MSAAAVLTPSLAKSASDFGSPPALQPICVPRGLQRSLSLSSSGSLSDESVCIELPGTPPPSYPDGASLCHGTGMLSDSIHSATLGADPLWPPTRASRAARQHDSQGSWRRISASESVFTHSPATTPHTDQQSSCYREGACMPAAPRGGDPCSSAPLRSSSACGPQLLAATASQRSASARASELWGSPAGPGAGTPASLLSAQLQFEAQRSATAPPPALTPLRSALSMALSGPAPVASVSPQPRELQGSPSPRCALNVTEPKLMKSGFPQLHSTKKVRLADATCHLQQELF